MPESVPPPLNPSPPPLPPPLSATPPAPPPAAPASRSRQRLIIVAVAIGAAFLLMLSLFSGAVALMSRFGSGGRGHAGIDRVLLDQSWGVGHGGFMTAEFDPIILFKNGTATREPKVVEPGFDRARHQKEKPKSWGRWRQSGKKIVITWGGGKKPQEIAKPTVAPPPPSRLDGSYSAMGGGGNLAFGGTTATFWSRSYTFTRDGRFTSGSAAGASSSGDGWGGGSGGVATHSKKATSGRYRIRGHTHELDFDDGSKQQRLIYFFGKDGRVCGIGGTTYTRKK